MSALALITALALSGVFGIAGVAKLRDPAGTRTAVRAFGGPALLTPALALALPLAELAVAVTLLVPAARAAGALGALGLLALFSAVIVASLARGKSPECHCFGQLHSAPASWRTVARNGALASIAAGLAVAARDDAGPSAWGWIAGRTAAELGLIAGAVAVTSLIVAVTGAFLALLRAHGRVLLRVEATERALEEAGIDVAEDGETGMSELGLDPGTLAPQFAVPLSDGERITRDGLLARERPVLLVFTSPGCAPCHAILPTVRRWQRELDDRLTVGVVSVGEPDVIRADERDLAPVLVDRDHALSDAYLVTGTPSAVLIAPDATIASYVAAGEDEIEALVARAAHAEADGGHADDAPAPALGRLRVDGRVDALGPSGHPTGRGSR